jgi:hypothetical protein
MRDWRHIRVLRNKTAAANGGEGGAGRSAARPEPAGTLERPKGAERIQEQIDETQNSLQNQIDTKTPKQDPVFAGTVDMKNAVTKEVVINSDGTIQRFTKSGLVSSTKRSRDTNHSEMYGQLDRLISNAVFHSFEPADERHAGLQGQNVYYPVARTGGKYYSVRIKIDVSKRDIPPAYKDLKIEKEIIFPPFHPPKNHQAVS